MMGTPLNALLERVWERSICSIPVRMGSKLVMRGPCPSVELTKPLVPPPTPPAPRLVPPVDAPEFAPIPPTPPPGVFSTTPALTPRMAAPALARRISVSAIFKLKRAMAISRLFSSASATASFSERYSFPSCIKESMRAVLARFGSAGCSGLNVRMAFTLLRSLRPCKKRRYNTDVVADVTSSDLPGRHFDSVIDVQMLIRSYPDSGSRKMMGGESLQRPASNAHRRQPFMFSHTRPRVRSSEPQIYVLKQFKRG